MVRTPTRDTSKNTFELTYPMPDMLIFSLLQTSKSLTFVLCDKAYIRYKGEWSVVEVNCYTGLPD